MILTSSSSSVLLFFFFFSSVDEVMELANIHVSASKKWLILAALTCNFCPPNPRETPPFILHLPPPPGTAEPQAQGPGPAAAATPTTKNQHK